VAKNYDVTGQQQTTTFDTAGGTVEGVNVAIRTKPSNVAVTVFVPRAQYTPDDAAPLLDAAALNAEAVHQL
jgi:hypothetical protein